MKFINIFLLILIILAAFYYYFKNSPFYMFKKKPSFDNSLGIEKKFLQRCNLMNEIIDMKIRDNERQCYYDCGKSDNVRVDTSIEFPCQKYILENR